MNKKIYSTKILRFAKKHKAVEMLGGCCEKCGEDNILKLCFHHIDDTKDVEINKLKEKSWKIIEKEVKKCKLYCQNCHQELHEKIGKVSSKRENKKIYLKYIGQDNCVICGYNKCYSSLNFHHRNNKKFEIGYITTKFDSIVDLTEKIQNELDKCDVMCRNCHSIEHTDSNFYHENIEEIKNKSKNIKNKQSKINRNDVYDLYFNKKMKQIEIAKKFNASKGTISDIVKELERNVIKIIN